MMKTQSTQTTRWNRSIHLLLPVLIAVIFIAFTFSYYPFREKIQFDSDEGLNVMRSMLVVMGHPLYREVSSDQPPLFTQILALLFRLVGFDVNPARALVLLFSGLLVWACAQFLQLTWGKLAALFFLPLVIMVPRYLDLSVSVMIGIPSIALGAVSMLFVALWHKDRRNAWLILSGFALALSVLIKLFSGFLAPIFLAGVTIAAYVENREGSFSWRVLQPAFLWGMSFAALTILLGLILVGPRNVGLIIFPHLTAPATEELAGPGYTINAHLRAAVPLILLGVLGVVISIYRRNWLTSYPLSWAVLAYGLFSFYSPVFYHHQLLITIPAAMLGAVAIGDGLNTLFSLRSPAKLWSVPVLIGILTLAGFGFSTFRYAPNLDKELMNRPRLSGFNLRATPGKLKVLRTMQSYVDQTNWIVTDMPMYAFRVGRPVPPILATFSSKRLATGSLTEDDILNAMREYKPEQVLMARFVIPPLEEYLQKNYTLVLSEEYFRLFLRNDLALLTN